MASVQRLKRRREFLRVAGVRRKWVAPGLILQAAPTLLIEDGCDRPPEPVVRIGFTVTRKVGNSVVRNRVRRRLRAAADLVMGISARAGYDYVLIGRGGTIGRAFPDLLNDLRTALRKLGALRVETDAGGRADAGSKEDNRA
ncbi:MAG: ribonuclease P protein component [Alphaproteobacteria bacterium]|nr:ribonuclease P protein component [Alphaproteobacteria bacterium]